MEPQSFIGSLGPTEYFALIFAAAVSVVFMVVRNRSFALKAIALSAFAPVPIVALFSKQFDIVGWHGYWHASVMYQITDRGMTAPEEPFYAGGNLRYPWVEHWIMAKASLLTGVNPLILTLLAETVAYGVLLLAAGFIASRVSKDPVGIGLSMLFAAFGISIFHSGLLAEPLARAFPPLWLESRLIPVDKFLNVSAAPIGYASMVVSAAAGYEAITTERRDRRIPGVIAGSTLVAALIHPLSWLGVLVYQGTFALLLSFRRKREAMLRAGEILIAVAVPSAVCFPYHRSISPSESSDGWMGITESWKLFDAKVADLAFFLATFALLAYVNRAELLRRFRERDPIILASSIVMGSFSTAYLVVRMAGRNEYKFLLDLIPAAAPFMALSLRDRLKKHPALAIGLLFLLLVPGGRILGSRPWFQVTDPARIEGRYHRSLDAALDGLYQYVATGTPKDAVFLAADLKIPVLGRRSMYIAVDAPWRGRDGWGLPRTLLLQWHVRRPDREMYRRQHLATVVLNPDWAAPPGPTMAAIQHDVPARPLFVHASYPALAAKFDATPGFSRRFTNAAGAIFSYDAARIDARSQRNEPPR